MNDYTSREAGESLALIIARRAWERIKTEMATGALHVLATEEEEQIVQIIAEEFGP